MCGIIGVAATVPVDEHEVARARDTMVHRGPDDGGLWRSADGRVVLGHRRLSILDLSPLGHQPLSNEDDTVWITFNGEIYNFGTIRRELEGLGHVFRSRTDTEVIVHAYEEWGARCVTRLRGMFAYAIWDVRRRRLVVARDRLGIKPLYYYWDGRTFAFASELKALEALPGLTLTVDETALYDFLTYQYVPAPKTTYTNARKLLPGHTLTLEDGRVSIERYWDVDFTVGPIRTEGEALEQLRPLLEDAVKSHLVADVPVGSLLSGGVDSSAVTALAQRHVAEPLRTFSLGFDVEAHSETHYARLVAEALGTKHVEETVAVADARASLERLLDIYDEPFGDSSSVPTIAVSALARRSVKVALSGDGGDELFGGYGWYARHRRRAPFSVAPAVLRRHLPALLERSPLTSLRGVPTVIDGLRPDLERHVAILGGFTRAQKRNVLRPEVWRRFDGYDDLWYFSQHWRPDLPLMSRLQLLDLKTYLPDDILVKVDRASMTVSLELRPPLLDHPLVEFVAALPDHVRTPDGRLKHLFKQALVGLVSPTILDRPKKGFGAPMEAWIDDLAGAPLARSSGLQRWLLLLLRRWCEAHQTSIDRDVILAEAASALSRA